MKPDANLGAPYPPMATSLPYHPDLLDNAPWAVSFLILALAPMPLFGRALNCSRP